MPQAARKKHHNLWHYLEKNVFHTKPHNNHASQPSAGPAPEPPLSAHQPPPPVMPPVPVSRMVPLPNQQPAFQRLPPPPGRPGPVSRSVPLPSQQPQAAKPLPPVSPPRLNRGPAVNSGFNMGRAPQSGMGPAPLPPAARSGFNMGRAPQSGMGPAPLPPAARSGFNMGRAPQSGMGPAPLPPAARSGFNMGRAPQSGMGPAPLPPVQQGNGMMPMSASQMVPLPNMRRSLPNFTARQGYFGMIPAPQVGTNTNRPEDLENFRQVIAGLKPKVEDSYKALKKANPQKSLKELRGLGHANLNLRVNNTPGYNADAALRGDLLRQFLEDDWQYARNLFQTPGVIDQLQAEIDANPDNIPLNADKNRGISGSTLTTVGLDMLEMMRGYLFSEQGIEYIRNSNDVLMDMEQYQGDWKDTMDYHLQDIFNRSGPGIGMHKHFQEMMATYGPDEALRLGKVIDYSVKSINQAFKYHRDGVENIPAWEWAQLPNATKQMIANIDSLSDELYAAISSQ